MQNPQIQKLLHSILTPALAGAAGTGAASAYFSQRNHDPNESKGERRRRILRNAMYGTALGGAAGAAIPAGAKMLGQPFFGKPQDHGMALSRGADRAVDFGLKNFLPVGVAGAGGWGIYHSDQSNKTRALQGLSSSLSGVGVTPHDSEMWANKDTKHLARTFGRSEILRSELHHPQQIARIMGALGHDDVNKGFKADHWRTNEKIQATGHPGFGIKDMAEQFGDKSNPATAMRDATGALKEHLGGLDPFSRAISRLATERVPAFQNLRSNKMIQALARKMPSSNRAVTALEDFNPSRMAEAYSRYVRPSAPSAWETLPPALKLGLLGGGVLGASHLQKKLMGN